MTHRSPQRITEVYIACQFREGEDWSELVPIEGRSSTTAFHRGRLLHHRDQIEAFMLSIDVVKPPEFQMATRRGIRLLLVIWTMDQQTVYLQPWQVTQLYQLYAASAELSIPIADPR